MTSSLYDDGTLTNRVLQPYLEAVSNVSSSNDTTTVVRAVIHKLLQDSNIFIGYNIMKQHLLTTSMKTGNTIDPKLLNTLDLFSYGTISDYITDTHHDKYMTLTEAQTTKLRHLTALSVIIDHHHQGIISYHDIHKAAFMRSNSNDSSTISSTTAASAMTATIRDTEGLLSPLIASKMIVGKLSQKKMSFILGMSHDKNNQSSNTNNSSSGTGNMETTSTAIPTDSTFSKSLLVLQSRDINVHDEESTNVVPKLISSIQRMRTQINDAHQYLIKISQPEQQQQSSSSLSSSLLPSSQPSQQQTASTMMTTTMPMEVERIRLSTTTATTSAKRSRSSDGSSQNI